MPGALAIPLLVLVECLNLHWPSGVSQCVARGQGKDPAGVAGKGVWGRLEVMLDDVQHLGLTAAFDCPGANPMLRSHCQPWSQSSTQEPLVTWCWSSNTLATRCGELTHWKRPWCWERWQEEKEVTENEMVVWHHWFNGQTEKPGVLQLMGVTKSQTQTSNWTTTLTLCIFSSWHYSHILK